MFVGIYEVVRSGKKRSLIVVVLRIKEKDQQSGQEETCKVDIAGKSGNGNAVSSNSQFHPSPPPPPTLFSPVQPILVEILSGLDIEIKRNPTFSYFQTISLCAARAALSGCPQKCLGERRRDASDVRKGNRLYRRQRCASDFMISKCGGARRRE